MNIIFEVTTGVFGLISLVLLILLLVTRETLRETKDSAERLIKTLNECLKPPNLKKNPSMVVYDSEHIKLIFAIRELRELIPEKNPREEDPKS